MRPRSAANYVLRLTRSRAKMREYRVEPADYIELPREPDELFGLAVGLLGDAARTIADGFNLADADEEGNTEAAEGIFDDNDETSTYGLQFAATFFDAYLEAGLDPGSKPDFGLLCASAYYLSDVVGSAVVVARRTDAADWLDARGLSRTLRSALLNDFSELPPLGAAVFPQLTALILSMRSYFAINGDAADLEAICDSLRSAAYNGGTDRELLFADILAAVCRRKLLSASRRLVPLNSGIELSVWRDALVKPGFPVELWPGQRLICEAGLLAGRSAVIQMPTSAGKTRATELIIRAAFLSKRTSLCVIVAPFRSLCHDIRGDLARAFGGESVAINEPTDSYHLDVSTGELAATPTILIVTPEKLLYMLRRVPDLIKMMGLVIYDEGHQFDGLTRGPTYELLLSTLKMSLSEAAQTVLISAVIGNAPEVADWLIGDSDAVVVGTRLLPTTKSIAFSSWETERGQLRYVSPTDPNEDEYFVPRIITRSPLSSRERERKPRVFPESEGDDVGLYLGLKLVENGAVAVFCGLKATASNLCNRLVDIVDRNAPVTLPLIYSDTDEIAAVSNLAALHLGVDADVAQAAAYGVLAHHAEIPHGLRLSVEHAMKDGKARFVICTSTLAQGVNFPIKYLIITATQQGRERIKVRDFHNLMGRAGRAGMHTEGSVIFSAPTLYDQRKAAGRWRWDATTDLLDVAKTEPTRSSILSLFEDYHQRNPPVSVELDPSWLDLTFANGATFEEIVSAALAKQPLVSAKEFRNFIEQRGRVVQSIAAYIASHMTFDDHDAVDRVQLLIANTLAYHLADETTREKLSIVFLNIVDRLRNNADGPRRTLIRKSPLAPSAIFELEDWVQTNLEALREAYAAGNVMEPISTKALELVTSSELTALTNPQVIPLIWAMWRGGESFAEITKFLQSESVKQGRYNITVEAVVAICESGFGYDLAMILASLADLLEERDEDLHDFAVFLQRTTKVGLSGHAALAFYEAGFADRVVAAKLAKVFAAETRKDVQSVCRDRYVEVLDALAPFPSYFTAVAEELAQ